MPSEQQKSANSNLTTQPEKPFHYTYLKEFRTQQCQDFLQHKCPNHRPFTCFHWHFMNQRRRRPIRRRDGIFNYSPDVYCTKYDETTGLCADGEDCAYLHRTTGDTERRYHLRYYKTGTCVHETDARGHCVKNGPHCAFAHGPHDLRQPVYDIREMMAQQDMQQQQQPVSSESSSTNGSSLSQTLSIADKDKIVQVDDPKWQDTNHVLAYYKTEPCKKPPRLCRQGYACPHYHNARDRRRSPKKLRCYRSTPCPNVKHGDEWGEISNCDQGDNCLYCHTRTEQQFHPEIYKSTKCNDMQQTGYCPRGPFCAFAHVDQEMSNAKNILEELNTPEVSMPSKMSLFQSTTSAMQSMPSNMVVTTNGGSTGPNNLGPIGKPRSNSQSSNYSSESGSYQKAPGSEREDTLTNLKKLLQNVDNDVTIDSQEKNRRKQNLLMSHNISPGSPFASSISNCGLPSPGTPSPSSMSVNATPFYPPSDTVGSVVGNALDDISIEDVTNFDRELIGDNDGSSVGSSSASLGHLSLLSSTAPVNIPMSTSCLSQKTTISESPGSPLNSLPPAFVPQHIQQQQQIEIAAKNAFFSQPNPLPNLHKLGMMDNIGTSCSPSRGPQSPLLTTMSTSTTLSNGEVQRLQEEVIILKNKLQSWEESWNQAKQACDAWKKEASDSNEKAKAADLEKQALVQAKEEAKEEAKVLKLEIEGLSGGPHLHVLNRTSDLKGLPLHKLKSLQLQLRSDLDKLEKVIHIREGSSCYGCQDKARNVVVAPCYHLVFCELCAPNKSTCSICHGHVVQRITIHL